MATQAGWTLRAAPLPTQTPAQKGIRSARAHPRRAACIPEAQPASYSRAVTRPGGAATRMPRIRMRHPLLALIAASFLWGAAVSGTKYALAGFGPATLLGVELVAATAFLWAVLLIRGYRPPRTWWLPALLGLLEPALAYLAEASGLSMTSAVHGSLISGLESAIVVVLAAAVLREAVTWPSVIAVLVALVGLIVLAGSGAGHGTAAGDLLVAGGVLSAGLYTVLAKRFDDGSDALSFTAWQFTSAACAALAVMAARWAAGAESPPTAVASRYWIAAALIGIGGFGVSFLLFNAVIGQVDAGWTAVVLNLIPVFGFLTAVIFLGEHVAAPDVIGALLVGSSVLYFTVADRRDALAEESAAVSLATAAASADPPSARIPPSA
jgi:O-acetylserine/cysteine efflux transporter